jgi:hypothetical protein
MLPDPEDVSNGLKCAKQGTLIASAVTGSIQWQLLATAHWFVYPVWYGTLLLSLVCIMVAFYLTILMANFSIHPNGQEILLKTLRQKNDERKARWISLFTLQLPIMLFSYSLISYVLGLLLLVMRPLWNIAWGKDGMVSCQKLSFFAAG